MRGLAAFSEDRLYRYALGRFWDRENKPSILFIGLNPASADAYKGDHTIRRCINFAIDWGYGSLWVANLFAFRTPYPNILFQQDDPIGIPYNDLALYEIASKVERIVAAWGNLGEYKYRNKEVLTILSEFDIYCLGLTKSGNPKHPLYLKREEKLQLWRESRSING